MNPEDIKYETDPVMGSSQLDFDTTMSITGKRFQLGAMQTANTIRSTWLMASDMDEKQLKAEFDQMDADANKVLTPQEKAAMKEAPWFAQATWTAEEMVPGILASSGSGVVAGASQKAIGGAAGALVSRVHPVLGALVTVGTSLPASTAATLEATREQVTGEAFKSYIQQGLSKDSARNVAIAYGLAGTALEYTSLKTLQNIGGAWFRQSQKDAMANAIKGNKTLKRLFGVSDALEVPTQVQDSLAKRALMVTKDIGKEAVTESTTEALQAMAQDAGFQTGSALDSPEAKDAFDKFYRTVDPKLLVDYAALVSRKTGMNLEANSSDIFSKGATTFLETLGPAAILGGGTMAGSSVIGTTTGSVKAFQQSDMLQRINEMFKSKTPNEIVRDAINVLHDTPDSWETPEMLNKDVLVTDSGRVVAVDKMAPEQPQLEQDPTLMQQQPDLVARIEASPLEGTPLAGIEQQVTATQDTTQTNADAADVLTTAVNQAIQAVDAAKQLGAVSDPEVQAALDVLYPETQIDAMIPEDVQGEEIGANQDWTPMTQVEIDARLRQISTHQKLIRTSIRAMEADFIRRENQGRDVSRLLDKLETLMETQEGLSLEQEMLEAGLLSREDMGRNEGQMRMTQLARIMDKIKVGAEKLEKITQRYNRKLKEQQVNDKWKQAELKQKAQQKLDKKTTEAFGRGQRSEKRLIKWVQKQLTAAINAGTRDKNIRGQLYKMVTKATSRQDLTNVGVQIQTQLNDLLTKKQMQQETDAKIKLIDKIERLLKQGKVKMQSGRPTAKFDADTTALIGRLKSYVSDSAKAQQYIDDFNTLYANVAPQNIPNDALHEFQLASQLMNIDQQSLLNANVAAANIAQLIADGKDRIQKRKDAIKAEMDALVVDATMSIMPDADERIGIDPTAKQALQQNLDSNTAQILTFNSLMEFITPYDPDHMLSHLLDPTQYKADYHSGVDTATGLAWSQLTTALNGVVKNVTLGQYMFDASNEDWSIQYRKSSGAIKKDQISRAKAIDLYMKIKDPTLHDVIRNSNKLTLAGDVAMGESFEEQMLKILKPEDIAVADAIMDFYQSYYGRLNDFYREKYGVDLPKNPFYSPLERRSGEILPSLGERFASIMPGSSKSRVASDKELRFSNPFSALEQHIDEWEHAIASDHLSQQMRSVFTDSTIVKTIEDRHGYGTVDVIRNYIERFINNSPIKTSRLDSIFTAMQSDISSFALGGRHVYSALTQMSSMSMFFGGYTPQQILKGIGASLLDLSNTQKQLGTSKILDARFRQGPSFELKNALRNSGATGALYNKLLGTEQIPLSLRELTTLQRILFDGMRYGDAFVSRLAGGVVYQIELQNGNTPEGSLQQVERLAEQTQQSAHVDQMPQFFSSHPGMYTFFGQFMMQPLQSYGHTMIAARDYFKLGSKNPLKMQSYKDLGKFLWKLGAHWMIPGFAMAAIRTAPLWLNPPGGDDDANDREMFFEFLKSTTTGPAASVPFIGQLIEMAWLLAAQPLIGEDKNYVLKYLGQNPFTKTFITNPALAIDKAIEYARDKNNEDDWESASDEKTPEELTKDEMKALEGIAKGTSLIGLPNQFLVQPFEIYRALEYADPLGALLAAGGWSTGSIQNRLDAVVRDVKEVEDWASDEDATENPNVYDAIQQNIGQPALDTTPTPMENTEGEI